MNPRLELDYSAADNLDIADTLTKLADAQAHHKQLARTRHEREWHKGAQFAYLDAARMLRRTRLTGEEK